MSIKLHDMFNAHIYIPQITILLTREAAFLFQDLRQDFSYVPNQTASKRAQNFLLGNLQANPSFIHHFAVHFMFSIIWEIQARGVLQIYNIILDFNNLLYG
ncbi:hypothetical protein ACJX0J_023920, partial [Zea mays]